MRRQSYVFSVLLLFVGSFVSPSAFADNCNAQTENPGFIQAQNLMRQVRNTSLEQGVSQSLERRWDALAAEQQSLWTLAGEVDAYCRQGENHPQLDSYNARVEAWMSALASFSTDAQDALANHVVWKRVPSMAPSDSCEGLGGTVLGTKKVMVWHKVKETNIGGGAIVGVRPRTGSIACSCEWKPTHELTETTCRRPVEEEAVIDGIRQTRTRNIQETFRKRQPVLSEEIQTTTGSPTIGGCMCKPPDGGVPDKF